MIERKGVSLCSLFKIAVVVGLLSPATMAAHVTPDPPKHECFSDMWVWDTMVSKTNSQYSNWAFRELSEGERLLYLYNLNSTGAPTGIMFERIGYFRSEFSDKVLMMYGMGECAWTIMPMPKGQFINLLGKQA